MLKSTDFRCIFFARVSILKGAPEQRWGGSFRSSFLFPYDSILPSSENPASRTAAIFSLTNRAYSTREEALFAYRVISDESRHSIFL